MRQATGHPGYVAPDAPYDCQACIAAHASGRVGGEPFPLLGPDEVEAWNLYLLLQDQVLVGMDIVGLDYATFPAVFTMQDIPRRDWRRRFEQLVILNHAAQEHRAQQRLAEQATKATARRVDV